MPPDALPGQEPAQRPSRPTLRPAGPVIRAADTELWADAAQALAAADRYAERTRHWARATYFRERDRGREEGRREGADEAVRLAKEAQSELRSLLGSIEDQLPRLLLDIAENLFGAFEPEELLPLAVRKALTRLEDAADIRIKVAPTLQDAMKAALAREETGAGQRIRIEADPSLAPGACVIWSEFGNVDLSLTAQLKAMRDEMRDERGRETRP